MTMEKHGVSRPVQHLGLRKQEAELMQQLQSALTNRGDDKIAASIPDLEDRLAAVRQQLTDLDRADPS